MPRTDLGRGTHKTGIGDLDGGKLIRDHGDGRSAQVLLQTVELGGAGDGRDLRHAGEQPGQRHLRGDRVPLRRQPLPQVDHGDTGCQRLGRDVRHQGGKVDALEAGGRIDGAG